MKKTILITAGLIIMAITYSIGQSNANNMREGSLHIGPVAGFGSSWIGYAPGNAAPVAAGYGGVGLVDMVGRHWGLGGNLTLSSEGYRTNYPGLQRSDIPLYLRMPLRAYYFVGGPANIVRPDIYLGPGFGAKLSEHMTSSNYNGDVTRIQNASNFRSFDAGVDGGAGINIQLSHSIGLNFDLGYYQGITDALKDAANTYNTDHDFDVDLGLYFDIK